MRIFTHVLLVAALAMAGCNLSDPISQMPTNNQQDGPDSGGMDAESDMRTPQMDSGRNDVGPAEDMPADMAEDMGVDMPVDMGPPPPTFEEYCQEIAVTYLTWLATCYGDAYYDPTNQQQLSNFETNCMRSSDAIELGTLSYDAMAAESCLAALENENCDYFNFYADVPECDSVIVGQQAIGENCHAAVSVFLTGESECAEGYCLNDGCPGTCTAFETLGETCGGNPYVRCDQANDEWCNYQNDTCEPMKVAGESCQGAPCVSGLKCHYDPNANPQSVCVQPIDLGGTCDATDDRCANGTFCSDGTCKSKVATGEACRYPYQCPSGESCFDDDGTAATSTLGVCGPRGVQGDACYVFNEDCAAGFYCQNNVCQALPTANQACLPNGRCADGLWCRHQVAGDTGVCQPRGQRGQLCMHGYGAAEPYEGCQTQLVCVDGVCRNDGEMGDPCEPGYQNTCIEGLFCARDTKICVPLAAEGGACNPWWYPSSCQEGLGCFCDPSLTQCPPYDINQYTGDVCQPALSVGQECERGSECESLGGCYDHDQNGTRTCQPGQCFPPVP